MTDLEALGVAAYVVADEYPVPARGGRRLVIDSVFSNLELQMRLEQHSHERQSGLAVRIAQRILALTIGILLNTSPAAPHRALAAYDGR